MRHNPKSKTNAGRRLKWDAKKGKSVQKPGRPSANKAPANMDLMEKTKDQLVKMGTPAAKAELKRRGRRADGRKEAWSGGAKKAPARRGRARRNPEVSALGNPFWDNQLLDSGRFFIRLPYNFAPDQNMINTMPPAVIFFVGRGEALDRKSNLVLATYDFRAGNFGDATAMSDVITVRSEDEAMEKLRSKSYPRRKSEAFAGPYNLFQVTHSGHALTVPELLQPVTPFILDQLRKSYPELRKDGVKQPAFPYDYPWTASSTPVNKAMSFEQIFDKIYYASADLSVPWRDASQGERKRVIVTEYAGKKSMRCQEASYVEGNPEKRGSKSPVVKPFNASELQYALQGISDTLISENSQLRPGMIEFAVFPHKTRGDIIINVVLWKLVTDEWAAWASAAVASGAASIYGGYPPVQGSTYMTMQSLQYGPVGVGGRPITPIPNPRRARHNPEFDEIEIEEDDEEALENPRRRRRSRRKARSHRR